MAKELKKLCAASFRANWLLCLIVLLFFVLGGILGVLAVDYLQTEQVKEVKTYLNTFIEQADSIEFDTLSALKANLISNLTVILIIYLVGLTVLGIPVVLILLLARGFTLGFAVGFLTKHHGWQGLIFTLASVLPPNLFYIPIFLLASMAAISFSILLIKRFFNSRLAVLPGFIGYNLLFLCAAAITVGGVFVEVYLTPLLIQKAVAVLAG